MQLNMLGVEYLKEPKLEAKDNIKTKAESSKRVRYEMPTFIKFYSLYQYDRVKFSKLLKIWLETNDGKNRTLETLQAKQNEILELCYKRDVNGKPLKDSDEKHIYRVSVLNYLKKDKYDKRPFGIYTQLYAYVNKNAIEKRERYEQDGLAVYPQEEEAEILNTWNLPLGDRVKIHLKLLRLLRNGFTIKGALEVLKNENQI